MGLTLYNKLIVGNRKNQAILAGAASAVILGISAFRQIEEDDKDPDIPKLVRFSLFTGLIAGTIWGCTTAARRKAGKQETEIVKEAVRPVVIIGLAATLKDVEDERYLRRYSSRNGSNSSASSSSSSRYSSGYNKVGSGGTDYTSSEYPSTLRNSTSWLDRAGGTYSDLPSNPSNDESDDETLSALGTSVNRRSESARSYDTDLDDEDDFDIETHVSGSRGTANLRDNSFIGSLLT